jgi:hypothetical protein
MSRKPVDQQQPSECRQAVWDEIISNPETPFTITEMSKLVRLDASTVRDYIIGLFKAGYLGINSVRKEYFLLRDTGNDAPRVRKNGAPVTQGRGRQQMWDTMDALKLFTAIDLARNASTEEHIVAISEAITYCATLCKAGYLVGRSGQSYLLVAGMWTGPKPPQIQRTKQVYDPNLKRVVWSKVERGAE